MNRLRKPVIRFGLSRFGLSRDVYWIDARGRRTREWSKASFKPPPSQGEAFINYMGIASLVFISTAVLVIIVDAYWDVF